MPLYKKVINKKLEITKQDLIALTFTPIMSGQLSKLDKIIKSIRLVKKIDNEYKYDVESMLYAFADKFLKGKDLEKVKEEISMTKLGEMLVEDGIKKGEEKKAIEIITVKEKSKMGGYIKQLKQEFPGASGKTIAEIVTKILNQWKN